MDKEKIEERVAKWAARGLQVRRKDKDLMQDTGGISKGRDREPHAKPPRDDVKKRHKTKRKKKDEKDKDLDKEASIVERLAKSISADIAEREVERLLKVVLKGTPFANKTFAVGGYVRDEILGIGSKDLDVVVEMKGGAEKITKSLYRQFGRIISRPRQMGRYPIWQITFKEDIDHKGKEYRTKGAIIEFADSQKESFPDEGSRQRITEPGTLMEDVERRDFTTNMLLKDLTSGEVKDLTGTSVNDIKRGILRGHPGLPLNKILRDDPLRMMRLVRFQAKYGWDVPMDVLRTVAANAKRIEIVSAERIRDELIKVMKLGKLAQDIKLMKVVGLLKYVLPEIEELKATKHDTSRGHHQEGDVFRHTYLVLQNAKPGIENQLAALLHDVGKPATREEIGDKIQILGHEEVGAEMAEAIMRRLKFDKGTVKTVKHMVRNHMRPHGLDRNKSRSSKALRKFIRKVGDEMVDAILDLAEADNLGNLPPKNYIPELREEIEKIRSAPVQVREQAVLDGNEVLDIIGGKPGPMVGVAIQFLKDKQLEYAADGIELTKGEAKRLLLERVKLKSDFREGINHE